MPTSAMTEALTAKASQEAFVAAALMAAAAALSGGQMKACTAARADMAACRAAPPSGALEDTAEAMLSTKLRSSRPCCRCSVGATPWAAVADLKPPAMRCSLAKQPTLPLATSPSGFSAAFTAALIALVSAAAPTAARGLRLVGMGLVARWNVKERKAKERARMVLQVLLG